MEQWLTYLYHYGVGGLAFTATLVAMHRSGAMRMERPSDRTAVVGLISGLVLFMLGHAIWILAARP